MMKSSSLLSATLLLAAAVGGCATDVASSEESGAEAVATNRAGVITCDGFGCRYASTAGGDEFIHAGQSLRVVIPSEENVENLVNNLCTDQGAGCVTKDNFTNMHATVTIDFGTAGKKELPVSWTNASRDNVSSFTGATANFRVPAGIDKFRITGIRASDVDDPASATQELYDRGTVAEVLGTTPEDANVFAVYGGHAPDKTLVFDQARGTYRERIVEGGTALAPSSTVTLVYADYRADELVNKMALNLGDGEVWYQIEALASFDGFKTSQTVELDRVDGPRSAGFQSKRFTNEGSLQIPANAKELQITFHVSAFKREEGGHLTLLKDTWDNPGHIAGKNYTFSISR